MHIQTHILSGWCLGNLFPFFTPRERLFCMIAASAQDLDGLGILWSQDAYWDYHHKLGHGLLAGLLVTGVMTLFSSHRLKAAAVYFGLFHLHLLLDFYGSGPDWPLHYFWPFDDWELENPRAWEFFSWQNISTAFALLAWTVLIAIYSCRTPLEAIMPGLDQKLVAGVEAQLRKRHSPSDVDRSS